ncbi:Crp/Fnr family transcriptional regulator [Plantactinospora soyae]|uniref:CRP-like cAMP-binding protein n=1 Tax=Plantactinospora soyae TaxID=1544732 RepID=A0A927MCH5_9ACTN|nr:Crp/Fnr family transcriptional regulator [Plantactinospora soyae]MBE1491934.1 CRP-like cAMP-binding protein [Plantactinospora soyae]
MAGATQPRTEVLAPGSFLHRLSPADRDELLTLGVSREFPAGRRLIREGADDSHVELLHRGFVKVTTGVQGSETLLAIRMPGDILGETAAMTGGPRTATVVTCGRVRSSVVSRTGFERFLSRHPEAALHMGAIMGERLRWANQRRADFTAYPADVRVARILTEIATTCGQRVDRGILLGVALSQPELASMVGVADVTLQKALRALRRRNLVHTGYRRLLVLDLDLLREVGEGAAVG